jgi:hypothetical protein
MIRIEKWAMVYNIGDDEKYRPPELLTMSIIGEVIGHPKFKNGSSIRTGPIMSIDGRDVMTMSGNVYRLGERCPLYAAWMDDEGLKFDPENPIKRKANT